MRVLVIAALAVGCVDQGAGPKPKPVDPEYVQRHLLAAAPADVTRFEVEVGDVAIYVGNKVEPARVAPGEQVTITHYWRVKRSPGAAWRVFGIARGAPEHADFMYLPATDMERAHGPETWQRGELIEDVQTFTVRPDWRSAEATIVVGLIERGKHGTLDRMVVAGPHTERRAIVATKLEIDLSRAPPPKGTAHLPRARAPITIDGVASEPGWAGAAHADLIATEGGREPKGKTTAKMTWDDEFLYVFVNVVDTDIVSPYERHDDPLWQGDCIEVFIDADGNRRGYVELQASPRGLTFDKWYAQTKAQDGDLAWDSEMVAAAKLRGGVAAGDSGDRGYDVELAIPWAAVKGRAETMTVELPPKVGDRWRLNVVRVDRRSGNPKDVGASSWNRITSRDYHALDRMLTVVFADATGSIVPRAAADGAAAPPPTATRPAAPTAPLPPVAIKRVQQPGAIVVELTNATARFAGAMLADPQLDAMLAAAIAADPRRALELVVDATASHARVTSVIDRARAAGFGPIAIRTKGAPAAPRTPGISVVAPPSAGARLVIELGVDGAMQLDGKKIDEAALDRRLTEVVANDPAAAIVVAADRGVPYARVWAVIARAKAAGLRNFALTAR